MIRSDTACPPIDPGQLSRGRLDVVLDFALESLRAGAEDVYLLLCDGSAYRLSGPPPEDAGALARALAGAQPQRADLQSLLAPFRHVYYLHEEGVDIAEVQLRRDGLFVVGDQDGLSPQDESLLRRRALWISLGRTPYISWFCPVYLAWWLNRPRRPTTA